MIRTSVFYLLKWTSRWQLHGPRLFWLTFFLWSLSKDQSWKNLYGLGDILKKCNAKYLDNSPTFKILHRAIWVLVLHYSLFFFLNHPAHNALCLALQGLHKLY